MLFTLLLISSADTKIEIPQKTTPTTNDFQNALMKSVFQNQSKNFLLMITNSQSNKPVCDGWKGVKCYSNVVREVSYFRFILQTMCIEYLPPTVFHLSLIGCRQKFQLQTRHFPRESDAISLKANQIYGAVDIAGLPKKIQQLDLSKNRISGPIQLYPLPAQMTRLDVSSNRIRQETVYYHNLPETIEFIGLYSNPIQKIEAYIEEEQLENHEIFSVHPSINK